MERQRIARLLPEIFQRTLPEPWWEESPTGEQTTRSVLGAFLNVMETLQAPVEWTLAHLDAFFDPRITPEGWLPTLAMFLDLDRFLGPDGSFPGGPDGLRRLILAAVSLSKERGTQSGLRNFLETATGITGIEIKDHTDRPYHIVVLCPEPDPQVAGMTSEQLSSWLEILVAAEKPAYVTCDVCLKNNRQAEDKSV